MAKRLLTQGFIDSAPLASDAGERRYVWDARVPGLGVCIGTATKAFVFQRAVAGKSKRVTFGYHPQIDLTTARHEASKLSVAAEEQRQGMRRGIKIQDGTETLESALTRYLNRCREEDLSSKTLKSYERSVRSYLGDWLGRDLETFTGVEMADRHKAITDNHGPATANDVVRALRAIWNHARRRHDHLREPVAAVDLNRQRQGQPIATDKLPQWRVAVEGLRPIIRDVMLFGMYSGLRRDSVLELKWADVDFKARTIRIVKPKGGESRAFTLPLSRPLIDILKRRRDDPETKMLFTESPYVFPGSGKTGHLAKLEKLAHMTTQYHCLRHTYASAAIGAGVEEVIVKLLLNHSLSGGSVTYRYIHADALADRLRTAQDAVAKELTRRLGATKKD